MARRRMKTRERPLIERKDVPDDPNREGNDPRKGERERDDRERSDQEAGTGRPVQLDTGAGAPPVDPDWPEPSKDAPAQK